MKTLDYSEILQELHNSGIIFCMSSVEDGTFLWILTDTVIPDEEDASKMGYCNDVSSAIWDMAVEASIAYPNSRFAKYFKTLQC